MHADSFVKEQCIDAQHRKIVKKEDAQIHEAVSGDIVSISGKPAIDFQKLLPANARGETSGRSCEICICE